MGELMPIIRANVAPGAAVLTDDGCWYRQVGHHFTHAVVNYSAKEYVRGDVHTNTVEGYFGVFKRGMKGVYQHFRSVLRGRSECPFQRRLKATLSFFLGIDFVGGSLCHSITLTAKVDMDTPRIGMLPRIERGPAGFCIYCGKVEPEVQLTTEHPIPRALGGNLEFPKSSCIPCADKIKTGYEQFCLGPMMFKPFRERMGFPTSQREGAFDVHRAHPDGNRVVSREPLHRHPATLMLAKMGQPTLITGQPPLDESQWQPWTLVPDTEQLMRTVVPDPGVGTRIGLFDGTKFAKFLAKIGYSFVIANCGAEGRAPPGCHQPSPLLSLILNEGNERFDLVGDAPPDTHIAAPEDTVHAFEIHHRLPIGGRLYMAVDIQLFAFWRAPIYRVIIAERALD